MSRRIQDEAKFSDVELRYAHWLKMIIDLMQPKNLFAVLGRGTGKTEDVLAERSMDVCYDMPRNYNALVGDTYTNIIKNLAPTIVEGWNRKGWRKGVNYVVDEPPPRHFHLPYKTPHTYKHTISTFMGNFFNYISMDTPSSGAGNSYQHAFGDEAKYLEKKRIDRLFPALRGDSIAFGHSRYFLGVTFTTDFPNVIMPGEYGWILDKRSDMNVRQMQYLLQISLDLNEQRGELLRAKRKRNGRLIKKWENAVMKTAILHHRLRENSTFFYIASSFANVDILTLDFFKTALASLGVEEFNTSVLSLPPEVEAGKKFYIGLDEDKHVYEDGINQDWYYRFNTGDDAKTDCRALRYLDPNSGLEMSVDFGDMFSMVVAQNRRGREIYVLKNFWTLPPESTRELCDKFLEFFEFHPYKVIDLWYDRAGNQYHRTGGDKATELKNNLEFYKDGSPTGWVVNLKSRGQSTIYHEQEFAMAKTIMLEMKPRELPKLFIDKYQCKQLISSMKVATQIVKVDANGSKRLHKNKSSEKLPDNKKPMYSTNLSDAFKYLICRKEWLAVLSENDTQWSTPEVMR